jgi:hypothetical protein
LSKITFRLNQDQVRFTFIRLDIYQSRRYSDLTFIDPLTHILRQPPHLLIPLPQGARKVEEREGILFISQHPGGYPLFIVARGRVKALERKVEKKETTTEIPSPSQEERERMALNGRINVLLNF